VDPSRVYLATRDLVLALAMRMCGRSSQATPQTGDGKGAGNDGSAESDGGIAVPCYSQSLNGWGVAGCRTCAEAACVSQVSGEWLRSWSRGDADAGPRRLQRSVHGVGPAVAEDEGAQVQDVFAGVGSASRWLAGVAQLFGYPICSRPGDASLEPRAFPVRPTRTLSQ
jgi:hypothetical protein